MSRYLRNLDGANHTISSWEVRILLSFLLLLLCYPSHAITWEERGGEAIRLGGVTVTTATPTGTYYAVTGNGVIAKSRDGGVISKLKAKT